MSIMPPPTNWLVLEKSLTACIKLADKDLIDSLHTAGHEFPVDDYLLIFYEHDSLSSTAALGSL
jgi:hypothetical protein